MSELGGFPIETVEYHFETEGSTQLLYSSRILPTIWSANQWKKLIIRSIQFSAVLIEIDAECPATGNIFGVEPK